MSWQKLVPALALGIAGRATRYVPPKVAPPALWDGDAGWQVDANSLQVNEVMQPLTGGGTNACHFA